MRVLTRKLSINLNQIRYNSIILNEFVKDVFKDDDQLYKMDDNTPFSTRVANSYNAFLYPLDGFSDLYEEIRETFRSTYNPKTPHYIQGWVNVYETGQNLNWHQHWSGVTGNSIHGFYCVQTEDSYTQYMFDNGEEITIQSEDNLLVMAKASDNKHKTSEWNKDHPRITIAFDIHPIENLRDGVWVNHWMPI